jgi:sulfatase maturation enzyme AslB (radical SAM superfamily)
VGAINHRSYTSDNQPRGFIQPQKLSELWFHTGTNCNLRCPFCFEGSHPGNHRLQPITLTDIRPFIEEAFTLGVKQFSFTGGEPFLNREMVEILNFCLDFNPCLVLTNATKPLLNKLTQVKDLASKKHSLSFRVSLDFPDPITHDQNRGAGNFSLSLKVMGELYQMGFKVSVARQAQAKEDVLAIHAAYLPFFRQAGLPEDTTIVSFTDLSLPGTHPNVPQITQTCMTTYKTQKERELFMCNYSKMVLKKDAQMRVYACTLVDDDEFYDLGNTLTEAMRAKIMLGHHRCFGCFSFGTSCSEAR